MGVFLPKVQSEDGIESLVRRIRDWGSGRHDKLFEAHEVNNKSMFSLSRYSRNEGPALRAGWRGTDPSPIFSGPRSYLDKLVWQNCLAAGGEGSHRG